MVGIFMQQNGSRKAGIALFLRDILNEGARRTGTRQIETGDRPAFGPRQFANVALVAGNEDDQPVRRAGGRLLPAEHDLERGMVALQIFRKLADIPFAVIGIDDEMLRRSLMPFCARWRCERQKGSKSDPFFHARPLNMQE